ncbi:MAG: DUF885 domain-containing protein [Chloroflexi bacterium]|nr:DUF885 domain-containing protein [Chloroflexota bacterium]
MNSSEELNQLIADQWEAWMHWDPLFATSCGDHRFNDRLPKAGEGHFVSWREQLAGFHQRLQKIEAGSLSPTDRLNYEIFARMLDFEISGLDYHGYRLPISKAGGFHVYFPDLYLLSPFETVRDYENFLARLEALRCYFDESIDLMRLGLHTGFVPVRVTLEGVDQSLRAHILEDPAASVFFKPFEQFPTSISEVDRLRLTAAAQDVIRGSVVPAYRSLLQFLETEYLPGSRDGIAAADLPDGPAFYQDRIRYFTTLDLSPEAIHATGQSEVTRIRSEMNAVIRKTGFKGSFREFIEFLRSDPRFYVTTPDALLEKTALVLKRMDGELPRLFKTLPRLPYGIRQIPAFSAPGNTAAYYQPGSGDGTVAGSYYVNTFDLHSRPLYEIEALSLHEAVPGHHLQIALQQELGDLPNFRRFAGFTSFVEGWALYSERLGLEVGFYQDPYSDFGRLSYEMWRACRLVVDTGMHALGWTRQQAIDFMAENTSSTLLNITNEVDRYIAWPGQALAYKLGELKMRALRTLAEKELGAKFNLREFHDLVLLGGAVPLDVLERRVREWVAEQNIL